MLRGVMDIGQPAGDCRQPLTAEKDVVDCFDGVILMVVRFQQPLLCRLQQVLECRVSILPAGHVHQAVDIFEGWLRLEHRRQDGGGVLVAIAGQEGVEPRQQDHVYRQFRVVPQLQYSPAHRGRQGDWYLVKPA